MAAPTAERLRSGAVLAAVTALAQPAAGCNSQALGTLRYLAVASPASMARHFADGVQARWVRRQCRKAVPLPCCHLLPSPQAFVEAGLAGMG